MPPETILKPNNTATRNEFVAADSSDESAFLRTSRLSLNLLANMLVAITVFDCLLYSCSSPKLNVFQLHIILCVLGYQFFMTQGTLVLSKYNSWSMYLARRSKRNLHALLQLLGIILVTGGSIMIIQAKHVNFETAHGILGLCALIASLIGLFNGLLAMYAGKLSSYVNVYWIKFIHYATGIGTILLSAVCLCLGFDNKSFKNWSGSEHAIVLMLFTCIFTVLVALDFWIATGIKIRNSSMCNV